MSLGAFAKIAALVLMGMACFRPTVAEASCRSRAGALQAPQGRHPPAQGRASPDLSARAPPWDARTPRRPAL